MEKNAQNIHTRKNLTLYITFVLAFIMLFLLFISKESAQVYNSCAAKNAISEEKINTGIGRYIKNTAACLVNYERFAKKAQKS